MRPSRRDRLWRGNARVLGTLALLRMYDREITRFLGETIDLLQRPRRYRETSAHRLERTLRHCESIPFYADRLAHARVFENGRFVRDRFTGVAPLTKQDIRSNGAALQHPVRQRGRFDNTSGGSTGEPVRFVQDSRFNARMIADTLLFGFLNGKRPGDREVKLWGSERDILEGSIGLKQKLINAAFNRVLLNSFAMDEPTMRRYIDRINQVRPVQIWAYVESILELARFAQRTGLRLHSPVTVVCTAGTMYPDMRAELEQYFPHSRVVNQYGSREVGQLACDVPGLDGMLLMLHSNHIELVDVETGEPIDEPGRPGRVLVTTLNNDSMPLVRFDIGDVAEYAPGDVDTHRAFARLHGRENTHFHTSNGGLVHGEYFTHLFYGKAWLETFQVAQVAPQHVAVRYVPVGDRPAAEHELDDVRRGIRAVMGDETEIAFHALTRIDRLGSGKYQFVRREFS